MTGDGMAEAHGSGAIPHERDDAASLSTPLPVAPSANPGDARTLEVRADAPWAEAGRTVLRFHLARMIARVPGVIAGEDPEEVHAMRVAARRMRAAWRVFGDGFEREALRRYRGELRDIGARLGAVRDLDVLIGIAESTGSKLGARRPAGIELLLGAWRDEREAARGDLIEQLRSPAFAEFVADYQELVGTPGLAAVPFPPRAPMLVRTRIPSRLWAAYQDVRAFEDTLATADLATLHELRIACKWLRYTLEFVREQLGPEAGALIRPVVEAQDHLGGQHDLHVAALRTHAFAASATLGDRDAKAIHRLALQLDSGVERLGRTFATTWRPVVAPGYRRRLGRAVARL
jgi:CHAD domain-containing protein